MTLDYYYFPSSHWSRIVSLAIAEKGVTVVRHFVDIRANATFEPEYIRMNPRGVVPTLVDDGRVVWNGPSIVAHLDRHAPPVLVGDDPDVLAWSKRLEDFPTMLLSYATWVLGRRGENSATILDDKVDRAARYAKEHPELADRYERKRSFFEGFRARVYDEEHVARQEELCRKTLDEMGRRVADGGYLCGEYSFPDAIATSILFRLVDLGRLAHWADDPGHGLNGYYRRLRERPSFAAVFVDDPLIP